MAKPKPPIDLRPKIINYQGYKTIRHFIKKNEIARSSEYWCRQLLKKTDVLAVTGYGAIIRVENGKLAVKNGFTMNDQTLEYATYARGAKSLHYLILDSFAGSGYITFDAIQWCDSQNIGVIIRGAESMLIHRPVKPATDLRRRQYFADPLTVAKWILREKFKCMLKNFPLLPMRDSMKECIEGVGLNTDSMRELILIEARTALIYWRYHTFELNHFAKWPEWWKTFDQRASNFGGNKNATHPVNAIFNYAYSIAAGMVKRHAIIIGLDTALGSLHLDSDRRDSLIYDILELVRADIDRLLLPWLKATKWRRTDFQVNMKGVVSLEPTLARVVIQKTAPIDASVKKAVKRYTLFILKL